MDVNVSAMFNSREQSNWPPQNWWETFPLSHCIHLCTSYHQFYRICRLRHLREMTSLW